MSDKQWGRRSRQALAAFGVAALAIFGAIAGGSAAYADGDEDPPPPPQVANIDPEAKGSVTVHKYQETGSTTQFNPDGSSTIPGSYTPLEGVEFTIYSVPGLSVLSQSDWAIFNTLTYDPVAGTVSGTGFGPVAPVLVASDTTNVGGEIVFDNLGVRLDLGVYLVVEGASGDNIITAKTAPFFVTIPLPNDSTWLYDVHVYPKNSVGQITKSSDRNDAVKVGDIVKWPVSAEIPQLPSGQTYTSYSISDDFDPRLTELTVESVQIDGVDVAYTLTGSAGQLVVVNPALATINANQGKSVEVVFTTKVASLGADGIIDNQAFVHLPGDVNIPSNEPLVRFGKIRIDKFQNGAQGVDTTKPLNGASFALYATQAEADAALAGTVGTPVWTGTITDNGTITTVGLYVGNTTDNATDRTYYLVETQAPAGYTRTDVVIPVSVVPSGETAVTIKQVGNTQRPPVALPLTGSTGTAVFIAAGLGLMLLAGGASAVAIRRRQEAAEK